MSLFEEKKGEKKSSIESSRLREALRNDYSDVGMKIGRENREKFAEDLSKKLGEEVKPEEVKNALRELRHAESTAVKSEEKTKIRREMDLLKRITGITDF